MHQLAKLAGLEVDIAGKVLEPLGGQTSLVLRGPYLGAALPFIELKRCLEIIVEALREVGAGPEHVVRTRVYIVDPADWEEVGRAHGELFGRVLPASAMLVVAGLLDPAWKVEIEADAIVPE